MDYHLLIGDRAWSSWSLRGGLLFDAFDLPVRVSHARLYDPQLQEMLAAFPPARTVPALRLPEGTVISESIAIAEELASRHPEAGIWPADPARRATARMLAAEMHVGFQALRDYCPMNLRVSYQDCSPPPAVLADLARFGQLLTHARSRAAAGPWLLGAYCAADVFFTPLAARIAGYNLPVGPEAMAWVTAALSHPSFRRWRAMGMVDGADQPVYRRDWPRRDWPGPAPLAARAVDGQDAVNQSCPCSGGPVSHVLELAGHRYGFCTAFCRDKTLADAAAWPAFMALVGARLPEA